jgi:hypothetical protein
MCGRLAVGVEICGRLGCEGLPGVFSAFFGFLVKLLLSLQVEKGGDRDSVVGCFLVARKRARKDTETKKQIDDKLWQLST